MGAASTAILAYTAFQGVSQISQGYAQRAEANLNASLLQGKANLIDVQKDIEFGQYQRMKGKVASKTMTAIASAGIQPTGSAMAYLINTQAQIGIDQAIGQFNLEREKNYTLAQAAAEKRSGKRAVAAGYTNAFSTALQGAYTYSAYKSKLNLNAGADKAGAE
jgi:hypothetical protein